MKRKQWMVLLVTIASLSGQYWINTGNTGLKTTAEVAGREEVINYTLPPDFIFSIWGVIYLGFLIYAVYGLTGKAHADNVLNRTAYPVAGSIFLNFVWTVVVGAELWLEAYFLQWFMLVLAVVLLYRWQLNRQPLSKTQRFLSIPFGLYAGWLTAAMIPFTADLLNRSGWDYRPFPPTTWAMILYFAACFLVVWAFRYLRQPFYLLPLAWAFYGFFVRFDALLEITAACLAVLLMLFFFYHLFRFYRVSKPETA